ncbi:MAG: hypothetical protein KDA96_01095 [Planctomycetaceae bacterium]|nr:hypothetical protein [Planctomycetaceae bacterium]
MTQSLDELNAGNGWNVESRSGGSEQWEAPFGEFRLAGWSVIHIRVGC